jgi:SMI1 / KNR4 family (SUKH-1)
MTNKLEQQLSDLKKGLFTTIDPDLTFSFKDGASENSIIELENYFKFSIPKELKDFLTYTNGCELFVDDDIDGYQFFDVNEIIEETETQKKDYEEDWDNRILIICSFIGEGNFIGIKIISKNEYEVIDCFHEEIPLNWNLIETSIYTFLENLIKENGEKYWLK